VTEFADRAPAQRKDADDEDQPRGDGAPGTDAGKIVFQPDHDRGTEDRAENRAQAAEQGHQHDLARHVPIHVGERGELEHQHLGRAGQPREPRRQDESQQLEALDVIAERKRARLVLADRFQHLAEG
jgi:hypothetical protein